MDIEGDETTELLTLRFVGENEDGSDLHELRAAHVAEVLQGVVGLAGDFARAGAFGDGIAGSEILVRPAREGSFIMEVVRLVEEHTDLAGAAAVVGAPSLSQIIFWSTKSARADVSDFEYLDNGNVKLSWQDNTVSEVPRAVWDELRKRKRRRKRHLQQLMAPLSDARVTALQVADDAPPAPEIEPLQEVAFTLDRSDYDAVKPEDEIEEQTRIFETEAQMSAIDFDNAEKWRVKTKEQPRGRVATVEDEEFLGRVARSLALRKSDIFRLRIREEITTKNGRGRPKWTVLEVLSHRRAAHDDDA